MTSPVSNSIRLSLVSRLTAVARTSSTSFFSNHWAGLTRQPDRSSSDRGVSNSQQRNLLAIELFELTHRRRTVAEAAVLEIDAQLVQEVDHRGRVQRLVRPVQHCLRFAHRLSNDTLGPFHR